MVGNPVRRSLSELDRAGLRAAAREFFGLDPDAPTLLVFGGSQGAARINAALAAAAPDLAAAGVGVLHAYGRKNEFDRAATAAAGPGPTSRVPVPGPDGPGLLGGRPGAGQVGCDDGRRDRRRRPARGLRAAAARQRRTAAERRRPGRQRRGDHHRRRRPGPGETVVDTVIPLVIDGIMRDGMTASAASTAAQRADELVARMVLDAVAGAGPDDRDDRMTTQRTAPVTADGVSLERAHLVGVGGAGMSGIARILADRGFAGVRLGRPGFADAGRPGRARCADRGRARRGEPAAAPRRTDRGGGVDRGPTGQPRGAWPPARPEIPVVRRADALAALMTGYRGVCIAGTHGKTSTTSMLTVALQQAGLDPSFAIGGELTGSGLGAHHGAGDIFVAEADESDGSFLSFAPHGAVITNLEPDHLDHHGTAEAYTAVFDQFVDRIEPGGFLVVCADDPGSAALAEPHPAAAADHVRPRRVRRRSGWSITGRAAARWWCWPMAARSS